MHFASDNTGPAHPKVLDALLRANDGYAPAYGADRLTARAVERIREVFEAPEAAVFLVGTGTAANALSLATLARPWQTVFCSAVAHVHVDECNAPEFFTGGAKLTPVAEELGRIVPETLRRVIAAASARDLHAPQPGPVTLTQATEMGTVYGLEDLAALTGIAGAAGVPTHMDGARFANALVHLGATPAAMTWRAGIDAVSFGGTKNGLLGVEAVVIFDPARAREAALRHKRGALLSSKHRYLAAQMVAYLEDGLWLDMAAAANAACARLAEGLTRRPDVTLVAPAQANMLFARWPRGLHRHLLAAGAEYHLVDGTLEGADDEPLTARLVCDWSARPEDTDRFLALMGA